MSYILLTICACLIGVSHQMADKETNPEFYEKAEEFKDECAKEGNVKKEEIEKLYNHGDFEDSDEMKCFIKCILEKMNVINSKGEIQTSTLRATLPKNIDDKKADEIIDKCMKVQSDDACETAFKLAQCCEDEIH